MSVRRVVSVPMVVRSVIEPPVPMLVPAPDPVPVVVPEPEPVVPPAPMLLEPVVLPEPMLLEEPVLPAAEGVLVEPEGLVVESEALLPEPIDEEPPVAGSLCGVPVVVAGTEVEPPIVVLGEGPAGALPCAEAAGVWAPAMPIEAAAAVAKRPFRRVDAFIWDAPKKFQK